MGKGQSNQTSRKVLRPGHTLWHLGVPRSSSYRIALSTGDSQRAQAARELLKAMRDHLTMPGYALPHIHRIAAYDEDKAPAKTEEVL